MVKELWVGKKVQVLSLEELEKNHYKDVKNRFWYDKEACMSYESRDSLIIDTILPEMQGICGKVCEVSRVLRGSFQIKEDSEVYFWGLWMVKDPISIQDVLNSD